MTTSTSPDRAIDHSGRAWRAGLAGRCSELAVASRDWLVARSAAWRYLLPVLLVAGAYVSREWLLPGAGDKSPFQTFVLAALLSALAGGWGPGLLATGLGGLLAAYSYLPPFGDLAVGAHADLLRLALFVLEGLLSAAAGEAVRRAAGREQTLSRSAARFRRFLGQASAAQPLSGEGPIRPAEALSEREIDVARLLALGLRNDEISARLFVSRNTVKTHLNHIYGKLGVRTRTAAVGRCIDLGLLGDVALPGEREAGVARPQAAVDAPYAAAPSGSRSEAKSVR